MASRGSALAVLIVVVLIAAACTDSADPTSTTKVGTATSATTAPGTEQEGPETTITSGAAVTTTTRVNSTTTTQPGGTTTTGAATTTTTTATTTSTTGPVDTTTTTGPVDTTSTTGPVDTTTTSTPLPDNIAVLAFAFASGADPIFQITSEVFDTTINEWVPAGKGKNPTLTGAEYSVRFTIRNLDEFGTITNLDVSGSAPGPGPLGFNICPGVAPLGPLAETTCVVGPFPRLSGDQEFFFEASGMGFRQGTAAGLFDPPLPGSLPYDDRLHSFMFVFGTPSGLRIGGSSDRPAIDLTTGITLSKPLHVDCSDLFVGGSSDVGGSPDPSETPVLGFVISKFTASGAPNGGCSDVPKIEGLVFTPVLSDDVVHYTGP